MLLLKMIQLPNKNFELLVNEVTNGVSYLDEKHLITEDVSEQFIDLETRLKSKKEL